MALFCPRKTTTGFYIMALARKGKDKAEAGPSTPRRPKAKYGAKSDKLEFEETPRMTAQLNAKAKQKNPQDVFVLSAETLHENDRRLAGYLGHSTTSALRDIASKPENRGYPRVLCCEGERKELPET